MGNALRTLRGLEINPLLNTGQGTPIGQPDITGNIAYFNNLFVGNTQIGGAGTLWASAKATNVSLPPSVQTPVAGFANVGYPKNTLAINTNGIAIPQGTFSYALWSAQGFITAATSPTGGSAFKFLLSAKTPSPLTSLIDFTYEVLFIGDQTNGCFFNMNELILLDDTVGVTLQPQIIHIIAGLTMIMQNFYMQLFVFNGLPVQK